VGRFSVHKLAQLETELERRMFNTLERREIRRASRKRLRGVTCLDGRRRLWLRWAMLSDGRSLVRWAAERWSGRSLSMPLASWMAHTRRRLIIGDRLAAALRKLTGSKVLHRWGLWRHVVCEGQRAWEAQQHGRRRCLRRLFVAWATTIGATTQIRRRGEEARSGTRGDGRVRRGRVLGGIRAAFRHWIAGAACLLRTALAETAVGRSGRRRELTSLYRRWLDLTIFWRRRLAHHMQAVCRGIRRSLMHALHSWAAAALDKRAAEANRCLASAHGFQGARRCARKLLWRWAAHAANGRGCREARLNRRRAVDAVFTPEGRAMLSARWRHRQLASSLWTWREEAAGRREMSRLETGCGLRRGLQAWAAVTSRWTALRTAQRYWSAHALVLSLAAWREVARAHYEAARILRYATGVRRVLNDDRQGTRMAMGHWARYVAHCSIHRRRYEHAQLFCRYAELSRRLQRLRQCVQQRREHSPVGARYEACEAFPPARRATMGAQREVEGGLLAKSRRRALDERRSTADALPKLLASKSPSPVDHSEQSQMHAITDGVLSRTAEEMTPAQATAFQPPEQSKPPATVVQIHAALLRSRNQRLLRA